MMVSRKIKILRLAAGGLILGICLYLLGYAVFRRSGLFGLNYPVAYLNEKLLLDQHLVLSDRSEDEGNRPWAEFRNGGLILLRPVTDQRHRLIRFYAPLIGWDFRTKRNQLEDEEEFYGSLAPNTCLKALARLLKRDTGLDGWKITEGSGRYFDGEFGDGVRVIATLKGADGEQLIEKLREVGGFTSLSWGSQDNCGGWSEGQYSMWEHDGMKRPAPGTKVAMVSVPDDPSDDNSRGPYKCWVLFLEESSIRILYRDGYLSS